ncbi:DUF2254 domain-containing protein [Mesorhizobium sp. CAU 1741]|uniref:DUF2254 domain-containing protein n=1 Tax=Mesorhizobium sp. CAU 1741 TaxID=3140366 RepID=UPI00325BF39D
MISKWAWHLKRLTRKLWLRAALISLLAVAAALGSLVVSPLLPPGLSAQIGADAVDNILNIIATSMLTVTTFSLSTMVAAYAAATSNVTPRATRLLIEDTTTQNVLATFVGSFLYSLVAIITLSMGAYGERGRVVLFAVTIVVIILIVMTLLRWIDYLLRLGRVGETTQQVEKATTEAMRIRKKTPNLGGVPIEQAESGIPRNASPIFTDTIGYVQHIDVDALNDYAVEAKGRIYLAALPGTFIDPKRPLAWCSGLNETPDAATIIAAFTIGEDRSFDQDPRFGLCVMAEIAQRAMSPAVNDPGTAIDVIGRAVRVLSIWAEPDAEAEVQFNSIFVPSIDIADLFDDVLTPLARDAAGSVEVQIRLQKAYSALARIGDARYEAVAKRHSKAAIERVRAAMTSSHDVQRVVDAAKFVGRTTGQK